jgi:(R,R)-butanediol dehydrogenase/meso-butanediol dehydrogenase/diacetyl reductase/L-iditol 2-dehydrogenase
MKVLSAIRIGNMKDPDESKRGKVATLDMPCSPLGDEDVKVKVAYCAICGSDPHLVGGIFGWEPPFGLGHEMSGVVTEIGKKVSKKWLKVGDRVSGNFLAFCGSCYYCRNGQEQFCENTRNQPAMAEYVVWHESQIVPLPDTISLKNGCQLEPVSIAVRILDKCNMQVGKRVAISGGGPIGLLTLQMFKMFGATNLTLIEPNKERQDLAHEWGADAVIDPLTQNVTEEGLRITHGLGYDVVVEVSGAPSAAVAALKIAAKGGTVLYAAMFPAGYDLPVNLYHYCYSQELTITGTLIAPYSYPRAIQILPSMDLDAFTEHVFSIDQPEEAFNAHLSGKYPKILIHCNSDLN